MRSLFALPSRIFVLVAATAIVCPAPCAAQADDDILTTVQRLGPMAMDEVVWLARCLYSESDREYEQELVAWVVRNRVESGFRGSTYREVVLSPSQFSAFNRPTDRRAAILGLDQYSESAAWKRALRVALKVLRAPASDRPFATETRHFYSPVSMPTDAAPAWAEEGLALSSVSLGVDPDRFRFYVGVDESVDPITESPLLTARERIDWFESARERIDSFSPPDAPPDASPDASEAKPVAAVAGQTPWTRTRRFSGRVQRPKRPLIRTDSRP